MPLNPIVPGLKPIRLTLDRVSAAKVQLSVRPGDTLEVSDDVAAQLRATDPGFKTDDELAAPKGGPAPVVEVEPVGEVEKPKRGRKAKADE